RVTLEERFEELGTELARVPGEQPVRMDVLLESVVEGIEVSGPLSGRVAYRCARCLKAFDDAFRLEVRELFAAEAADDDDEYPITEGHIDLEPMVRDTVVLSMPFSPLCREDCRGLCERCGGDRNVGECTCGPEVDPRWTILDELKPND
ncbi:MAG: YceD family protein, partial [Actinomycetota bacterium]